MDRIQLLSETVASQIAAGEVVNRPASVVKELVENSIDAGATRVRITVTDAGRTLIQVTDNGQGMSQADAKLAFQRHATSKIRETDDLYRLTTFGFRGEALPSIAAVSELSLCTRTPDSETGVQVSMSGGADMQVEPCVCDSGTTFRVRNLFFNVPARRKFLKGNQTEFGHIMTEMERVALAHPEVSFELFHQGQQQLSLPSQTLHGRTVSLFGKKMNQSLLPVEVTTSIVKISGFVSNLESARQRGSQQFFFVNGRFMRHPYFHKAVLQAFEGLIHEGDQPSYFLFFDISPDQIDVNIHPTKTEVKFQDEQVIWKILMAAVRETVGRFEEMPTIDFNVADMPEIPAFGTGNNAGSMPKVEYNPDFNPFKTQNSGGASPQQLYNRPAKHNTDDWTKLYGEAGPHQLEEPQTGFIPAASDTAMLPMWQIMDRYIAVTDNRELKLIDQHRAHVRILYDRFISQSKEHTAPSQGLLFPEMFQLSPSNYQTFLTIKPRFEKLGFDLSDMGHGAIAVQGVPAGFDGHDYENAIRGMIEECADDTLADEDAQLHAMALSMARSTAIPSVRHLSDGEIRQLVTELDACGIPTRAPGGQTISVVLTLDELSKRFG